MTTASQKRPEPVDIVENAARIVETVTGEKIRKPVSQRRKKREPDLVMAHSKEPSKKR